MSRVRQTARVLLQVDDTPHRIALAFGIGVFIAFFPIIGIHTGMALGLAFLLRLNRVAMLAGTFLNNPWTIAPMFMAGTAVGCALLGVPVSGLGEIDWSRPGPSFYTTLLEHLRPFLLPYLVGNLATGVGGGGVAYFALRAVLERRRQPARAS